jgi:hypothetical protein
MAKKFDVNAELKKIIDEGPPLNMRKPSFVGKRLKVSIARFIEAVLRTNELLPQSAKLTDERIKEMMRIEYADHEPTVAYFSTPNPLASYRGKYNRGRLLRSDPTAARRRYLSVPYNADGVPVRSKRPMSKSEYLSRAAYFELGVELDESSGGFIIRTTEHFGVVPKEMFKLRVNAKKGKVPAKAGA